jgi:hypothetical protein
MDLAERLRADAETWDLSTPERRQLERDAADEIERLLAEVEVWKRRYGERT